MLNVKEKQTSGTLAELYNTDYYTWAMTNAELLKKGKLDEIDYTNLAEEVKDLGLSEYTELRSYLANLLSHLYKWDNQPNLRTTSWSLTICNSVKHVAKTIKSNPGLKSKLDLAFEDAWIDAIDILSKDIKDESVLDSIPNNCPYSFTESIKKASEIAPDRIDNSDILFLNNIF